MNGDEVANKKNIEVGVYVNRREPYPLHGWISGRGETREEAINDLLEVLTGIGALFQGFANGTRLPLRFLDGELPNNELPQTHGLLIVTHGEKTYAEFAGHREFYLVPIGEGVRYRKNSMDGWGTTRETISVGLEPTHFQRLSEYRCYLFTLPAGSRKLVNRVWVPCEEDGNVQDNPTLREMLLRDRY